MSLQFCYNRRIAYARLAGLLSKLKTAPTLLSLVMYIENWVKLVVPVLFMVQPLKKGAALMRPRNIDIELFTAFTLVEKPTGNAVSCPGAGYVPLPVSEIVER